MRTELKNESPLWTDVVDEADEILNRIRMHQGTFDYLSQVKEGHAFRLVIRPIRRHVTHGQPATHQYVDLYHLSDTHEDEGKLHIARYYYQ